ncbi:MAG: exodeoxyribonuclease VII small subunit [Saprospiraceae bacterium]
MKPNKLSYEDALNQLEEIIENLQKDTYSLDQINLAIGKAKELLKFCEESLKEVQNKISEFKEE